MTSTADADNGGGTRLYGLCTGHNGRGQCWGGGVRCRVAATAVAAAAARHGSSSSMYSSNSTAAAAAATTARARLMETDDCDCERRRQQRPAIRSFVRSFVCSFARSPRQLWTRRSTNASGAQTHRPKVLFFPPNRRNPPRPLALSSVRPVRPPARLPSPTHHPPHRGPLLPRSITQPPIRHHPPQTTNRLMNASQGHPRCTIRLPNGATAAAAPNYSEKAYPPGPLPPISDERPDRRGLVTRKFLHADDRNITFRKISNTSAGKRFVRKTG